MRLNAAIALGGLSTPETDVDEVIERIRDFLGSIDANVEVGIELLAVGADFGAPIFTSVPLSNLLASADRQRQELLRAYWQTRDRRLLHLSLRIGHAVTTMSVARICQIMEDVDIELKRLPSLINI